ncbi:type II toxin-antitoxin system RelE/ParE family toxin [bacterium]|nr:type II toxin-antitoxin system RelE/ParE family toxin [bacterium]
MEDLGLSFTPTADRDMGRLSRVVRLRVLEKLQWFRIHANEAVPLPLTGQWKGFFKLRVGDWRVAYRINSAKRIIIIYCIDRRDKIYRRRPDIFQ